VGIILAMTFFGGIYEGMRYPQWIYLIGFIGQIVLISLRVYNIVALIIYVLFLGSAIAITIIFGEGNLDRIKVGGPFQVGHQDIFQTEGGNAMSVYYPIDIDEYDLNIKTPGRNPPWLRYGYKSRVGLAKTTADWGEEEHIPPWLFKYLDDIKMNVL